MGKYLEAQLLDHMVKLCLALRKKQKQMPGKLSSKVTVLFCTPTSDEWQFSIAPYHCQHLMLSVSADFSHGDSCVVIFHYFNLQFLGGSESTCNAGDLDSTPELGRSLRGGHGKPLQYPCLDNPHGQRSLVGYSPWGRKDSVTKHIDNHFICLSANCITSLIRCLFRSFAHFFIVYFL